MRAVWIVEDKFCFETKTYSWLYRISLARVQYFFVSLLQLVLARMFVKQSCVLLNVGWAGIDFYVMSIAFKNIGSALSDNDELREGNLSLDVLDYQIEAKKVYVKVQLAINNLVKRQFVNRQIFGERYPYNS